MEGALHLCILMWEYRPSSQGNNDDLILSCCLHYCNDKAKDFMPAKKGTGAWAPPPSC